MSVNALEEKYEETSDSDAKYQNDIYLFFNFNGDLPACENIKKACRVVFAHLRMFNS